MLDTKMIYKDRVLRFEKGVSVFVDDPGKTKIDQMDFASWPQLENSVRRMISKFSKDGDNALAMGVGSDELLVHYPHLNRFCIHSDRERLQLMVSKGINAVLGNLEKLPFEDESFDIIICNNFLDSVKDINPAISDMIRVLKKGGSLILSLLYKEDLKNYLNDSDCRHFRNFDESSLTLLFTRAFPCEVENIDIIENFSKDEKNMDLIKPSLDESQKKWYNGILKKYFFSSYVKRYHRSVINITIKK
jgi:SAM-dependent methyltransferase